MSLVVISTPLSKAPYGQDGFYTCGNYTAAVQFPYDKFDKRVLIILVDIPNHYAIISEMVFELKGWLDEDTKRWVDWTRDVNLHYENQRSN